MFKSLINTAFQSCKAIFNRLYLTAIRIEKFLHYIKLQHDFRFRKQSY
jgi:hypothetical protein